jgi:hypothetical protein
MRRPGLHPWHCDCSDCTPGALGRAAFHGQTDSSCSGEIISDILTYDDGCTHGDPRELFTALQEAALEVDAEPGLSAGFHVHVKPGRAWHRRRRGQAIRNFARVERALDSIAGGRWSSLRANNQSVRQLLQWDTCSESWTVPASTEPEVQAERDRDLYDMAMDWDRHTLLNAHTPHATFEYRVWNSTRSAWRMELFTRLSLALVDRRVNDALDLHDGGNLSVAILRQALLDGGHAYVVPLLDRQRDYAQNVGITAPPALTGVIAA